MTYWASSRGCLNRHLKLNMSKLIFPQICPVVFLISLNDNSIPLVDQGKNLGSSLLSFPSCSVNLIIYLYHQNKSKFLLLSIGTNLVCISNFIPLPLNVSYSFFCLIFLFSPIIYYTFFIHLFFDYCPSSQLGHKSHEGKNVNLFHLLLYL